MKSAYELAMERLEQEDPDAVRTLSDEQRKALGELDTLYQSKIAEKEVFLNQQIQASRAEGDREAIAQLEKQLQNERLRLEEEKEAKKDRIRNSDA